MKPTKKHGFEGRLDGMLERGAPAGVPAVDVHEAVVLRGDAVVALELDGERREPDERGLVDWRSARWSLVKLKGRWCLLPVLERGSEQDD